MIELCAFFSHLCNLSLEIDMSEEAVDATGGDPLNSVADALDAAVQAARDGVSDAASAASRAVPVVGGVLSSLTYKACYGVSYGVVFPTMFVVNLVPKENAAVHGFIDGARAAMDLIEEMKAKNSAGPTAGEASASPSS